MYIPHYVLIYCQTQLGCIKEINKATTNRLSLYIKLSNDNES